MRAALILQRHVRVRKFARAGREGLGSWRELMARPLGQHRRQRTEHR